MKNKILTFVALFLSLFMSISLYAQPICDNDIFGVYSIQIGFDHGKYLHRYEYFFKDENIIVTTVYVISKGVPIAILNVMKGVYYTRGGHLYILYNKKKPIYAGKITHLSSKGMIVEKDGVERIFKRLDQ